MVKVGRGPGRACAARRTRHCHPETVRHGRMEGGRGPPSPPLNQLVWRRGLRAGFGGRTEHIMPGLVGGPLTYCCSGAAAWTPPTDSQKHWKLPDPSPCIAQVRATRRASSAGRLGDVAADSWP